MRTFKPFQSQLPPLANAENGVWRGYHVKISAILMAAYSSKSARGVLELQYYGKCMWCLKCSNNNSSINHVPPVYPSSLHVLLGGFSFNKEKHYLLLLTCSPSSSNNNFLYTWKPVEGREILNHLEFQTALGHRFIKKEFGKVPHIGW
ncbi:hypothetical protein SUGI_0152040 [Cryptomeria japonica]|nr:hypothetical protein SUGI_0152040 [Cryptomeria japonica]